MDDRIKKVLYQIALLCLKILHWAIEPGSLALFDLMQQLAVPSRNGKTMRRSPLKRLVRAIDWIPSKSSRETVSALVADAQADLKKYRKQRRHILVRWRSFCTWAVVLYLVVFGPLVRLWLKSKTWIKGVWDGIGSAD